MQYINYSVNLYWNIDGLVQERRNSIANALALRLSCTDPSISTCFPVVSKLSKKIVVAEADRTEMESQLHESQRKYEDIKKKYDTTVFTSHNKLNVEEHVTVVQELKK